MIPRRRAQPLDSPKKAGSAFKRAFGVHAPKAQDNITDSDSRIMKTGADFEYCFNAQAAVDAHAQIVAAAELANCAGNSGELPTMLDAVQRNIGQAAKVALTDAGYCSEAVPAWLIRSFHRGDRGARARGQEAGEY